MTVVGWRDEGDRAPLNPKCEAGKCQCHPTCPGQTRRVEAFLAKHRAPPDAAPVQLVEKIAGHAWVCVSCRTEQVGPGVHCGYRIVLVERRGLELDATGRVTKATSAQVLAYYRVPRKPA